MTPASSLLDPASNPALYTSAALTLYVDLPDTPLRASIQDQRLLSAFSKRASLFRWSRPPSCWAPSAAYVGPQTCGRYPGSVRWPTSNPSSKSSRNTRVRTDTSTTCALSSAASWTKPARRKSKNLRFQMTANRSRCFAVPVNDIEGCYRHPEVVRFEIEEQDLESYRCAADFLNTGNVDVVSVQHEFGIFGVPAGSHLLPLLLGLTAPVVTTFEALVKCAEKTGLPGTATLELD